MQPLLTCLGQFECVCVLGLFECVCVCWDCSSVCVCVCTLSVRVCCEGWWGKNACAWLYDIYSCSCTVFLPFYKYGSFNKMGYSACLYFARFFSYTPLVVVNLCVCGFLCGFFFFFFIVARWRPSFKTGNGVAKKILV